MQYVVPPFFFNSFGGYVNRNLKAVMPKKKKCLNALIVFKAFNDSMLSVYGLQQNYFYIVDKSVDSFII